MRDGAIASHPPRTGENLALVLTGGGARAACQVGMLAHLARRFPGLRIPILTGVSAGALNIAYLATHPGTLTEAVSDLATLWRELTPERTFRADARWLGWNAVRWATRLASGGMAPPREVRGLLDATPLRELLTRALAATDGGALAGIETNLRRGALTAVAISTTNYSTEQSVIWVQGRQCSLWMRQAPGGTRGHGGWRARDGALRQHGRPRMPRTPPRPRPPSGTPRRVRPGFQPLFGAPATPLKNSCLRGPLLCWP